ncbi:MAG: ATP-dependent DNA helicase RecG [Chloroflexota bacterium]
MPSALESLVKILKLERKNGYKNNAVIGGMGAYVDNWVEQAHDQAKIAEHHILVDELEDLLRHYHELDERTTRHDSITYMLDRITGRVPPPEEYARRLPEYEARVAAKAAEQQAAEDAAAAERERRAKREQQREKVSEKKQTQRGGDRQKARQSDEADNGDDSGDHDGDWEYEAPSSDEAARLDIPPEPRLARPPRVARRDMNPAEAADIMRGLSADVKTVNGVGPRVASALGRLGIDTINDLLFFLPRRYDDYTRLAYISKVRPNVVTTIIGTVRTVETRIGRSGRKDLYIELDDGSGLLPITFFGQHYLIKTLRRGKQIVVSGKVTLFRGKLQMTNPEWEELDSENLHTTGIVPVYSLTEGLSTRRMRNLMRETVSYWAQRLPDYVPEIVLERTELADLGWAIENLHFPAGQDHLHHARRRYIFDQLLLLQMAVLANRRDWQSVPAAPLHVDDGWLSHFLGTVFPYEMTGAQQRAIEDIRRDISRDVPMNRLLQGDVGSGKTAVAVTAMAMAVANGHQAALMAPTSILAEQHYRGIGRTLENMPAERAPVVALLTGSLSASERDAVYAGLADGSIDVVIGTHALIQEGVTFHNLGLVVIDEQHRFGVGQRGSLRSKGHNPHLLVMSATPIPRTIALTIYADLDLSVMDEMPPGRTPIDTRIVLPSERERIYSFIKAQLNEGRQAFIVHPLVEASDKVDSPAAVEAYGHLSQVFFRHRVCLLHGRMKPQEKDEIMAAFANGEYDVMVTTSVAEVGVDVPNATVIVIEGANRFGLAQLHQFRGRVGRGGYQSYCVLIPDDVTRETEANLDRITLDDIENRAYPESERRLRAMELLSDGFELARIDWMLRGAGDLVGTRQSGRNRLQIAEMITPDLVEMAQQEARTLYEEDPYLARPEHHLLRQRVDQLYNPETDVS